MSIQTSRRSFMAAIPAVAVVATIPAAAIAAPADRRAWEFALANYYRAKAEAEAFDDTLFRIMDEWKAGRPSMDGIEWKEFHCRFDRQHLAHSVDLDREWQSFLRDEGRTWFAPTTECAERTKAKYRAALDSVQAYRDASDQWDEESGHEAANDHSEGLTDRMIEALDVLMGMPSPDLAALRWKLDEVIDADTEADRGTSAWSAGYVAQTMADIARLLPEAR
jgi:hypothetical protein